MDIWGVRTGKEVFLLTEIIKVKLYLVSVLFCFKLSTILVFTLFTCPPTATTYFLIYLYLPFVRINALPKSER